MRILITRPADDAAVTADAVRMRGHEPVITPLSEICMERPEPPPGMPAATIFTSRNAVRALRGVDWAGQLHALPAYCVGAATAQAAREAGFVHVIGGGGTGALLAEHIAYNHKAGGGALFYLTGDHVAFDMQAALEKRNLTVRRRIVYRSELVPAFPAEIPGQLRDGSLDAVMLMSARTACHFVQLAQEAGVASSAARLIFYCLSEPVARALDPLNPADTRVASRPTHDALIDLLAPSSAA